MHAARLPQQINRYPRAASIRIAQGATRSRADPPIDYLENLHRAAQGVKFVRRLRVNIESRLTMEEKGSDVNLAAYLLNDARKDLFEAAGGDLE